MTADVRCVPNKKKANLLSALATSRKHLAGDASNFVRPDVILRMTNGVNTGLFHGVASLQTIDHFILVSRIPQNAA